MAAHDSAPSGLQSPTLLHHCPLRVPFWLPSLTWEGQRPGLFSSAHSLGDFTHSHDCRRQLTASVSSLEPQRRRCPLPLFPCLSKGTNLFSSKLDSPGQPAPRRPHLSKRCLLLARLRPSASSSGRTPCPTFPHPQVQLVLASRQFRIWVLSAHPPHPSHQNCCPASAT